jgi:selenocysteine lyase/cysteine desulfurase
MDATAYSRRDFFGAAAIAAGMPRFTPTLATIDQQAQGEWQLAPGLTYLNTASLGPTPRSILNRTIDAWHELETNPVRMSYGEGAVHVATDRVREQAAGLLGCDTNDVLITRSTTDAMNTIALGSRLASGDRVLTTDQEHHGGSDCWRYLARRRGITVDTVPITPSDHDPKAIVDRFASAITSSTRLISVSHILTSTGLRMPVADLAALARARGILCIVDGAQALGQIAVDVKTLRCHAYAACGHKWLMAPKGTGLLYVSPDAADAIAPIQWQDTKRYVAGSTGIGSLPLVVGLGAAIERANAHRMSEIERSVLRLREYTIAQLNSIRDLRVLSAPSGPLASALVAVLVPNRVDSQVLQLAMRDKHNVMVKLVEKQWFNGIRISPHIFNTEADIDRAVRALRTELT